MVASDRSRAGAESLTAILMIDINYFKAINDTLGHSARDEVLRVVAARLRAGVRPLVSVGRLSGEEFLVVLPKAGIDCAVQAGKQICHPISTLPVRFGQHKIFVTCSIGFAASFEALHEEINALTQRVDCGLYRATLAARNRVEIEATIPRVG